MKATLGCSCQSADRAAEPEVVAAGINLASSWMTTHGSHWRFFQIDGRAEGV
jgi:hypothetical protein